MTTEECLREFNEVVIGGLEGCQKTKRLIKTVVEKFDKKEFGEREVVIMAFKSYTLMKEKQKDIMNTYGWTEKECPIVAYHYKDKYDEYYTTKPNVRFVPKEAKIIMMSQKGLQKCHYDYFYWEDHIIKRIAWVVVDEFEPVQGIIPSLHFLTEKWTSDSKKLSKRTFMKFLTDEYHENDVKEIKEAMRKENGYKDDTFKIAYWIRRNKTFGIKTIFLTAEMLAIKILNAIGFSNPDLEYKKFLDHTINIYPMNVDAYFFETLNRRNRWNVFTGFDTIISDKSSETMWTYNMLDLKVINHSSARGTNSMIGKTILTILSHIPKKAIEQIRAMLKHYTKEDVDYKEVSKCYYRDRLHQAVGRVLGHRGECDPERVVRETYVICNHNLYFNEIDAMVNDDNMNLCYNISWWHYENEGLEDIERIATTYRQNYKKKRMNKTSTKSIQKVEELERVAKGLFENDGKSRITFEDFRRIMKENGSPTSNRNVGKVIASLGGVSRMSTKMIGKRQTSYNFIEGIRRKSA